LARLKVLDDIAKVPEKDTGQLMAELVTNDDPHQLLLSGI
jgi:hypothetical protein